MGINIERRRIIMKGYANVTDISKFCGVGRVKANAIFEEIKNKVESDGKKVDHLGINVKRLLDYVEMKEAQVFKYAEEEEKYEKNRLA